MRGNCLNTRTGARPDLTRTMVLRRKKRRHRHLVLALFVVVSLVVAFFGTVYMPGDWQSQITKPPWTPPRALFAPIWTLLHVMMAVGAWIVWRHHLHLLRWPALAAFALQLILNALWSWMYFSAQDIGGALLTLTAVWAVLALTCALFFRVATVAGALLVPYLVWASFALALNFEIWRLN